MAQSTVGTFLQTPSITALFLIRFDKRVGYTIAWKRTIPSLDIDGIVEYKSLPSGLHNIKEDLVYFTTHNETYAGCSAFRSAAADESERGATFVAVGCLVRRGAGRLGKVWMHVDNLKAFSRAAGQDVDEAGLEQYWEKHREREDTNEDVQPQRRPRGLSESVMLERPDTPAANHPIHAVDGLLNNFGPLLFPLYRAALLRKKVMFISQPPMRELCDWVYVLSVISTVPDGAADDVEDEKLRRSKSLFAVGIHDIPELERLPNVTDSGRKPYTDAEEEENQDATGDEDAPDDSGYIACSSDALLATKTQLYDAFVRVDESNTQWPIIKYSNGSPLYATSRDLRRYKELRRGLARLQRLPSTGQVAQEDDEDDTAPLLEAQQAAEDQEERELHACVESTPWAAVAYNSFVWWASAGEKSSEIEAEQDQDRQLLNAAEDLWEGANKKRCENGAPQASISPFEVAVIGYFHRLTGLMFKTITQLLDDKAEFSGDDGNALLTISRIDMIKMGLDSWSKADRDFVQDVVALYFGIAAHVQGATVECCGVRIV